MSDVLRSSGSVGEDLLAVDWSASSLGEPDDWPLSLRNAVRILLTSKFSMWMAWGPELTFFCNEAYRRDTLGSKYPWALGRSAREVWSEIWPDIGPRIERVMRTGEATWDKALLLFLERSGYVEETYHTFSYSPLADDDGSTSGMLCVVSEDTEEVVSTRRMTTLRDLGVRMTTARSESAAVAAACELLATNPASLPFVMVYLYAEDGTLAHRRGLAGIAPDHPAAPATIDLADPDAAWPLRPGLSGESVLVEDLPARFPDLPTGAWTQPPTTGYVTPLVQPGEADPYGVLVVGLNRYRPFEESYRDFVGLIAGHLSASITDARAIEQEKQRSEELARIDRAKTDFFANVSHELRTPLTLLLGPAEDALRDAEHPLPPAQRDRLDVVARNGQRMLQLVNTLLDFSRLESGQDTSVFVATDLGAHTAELAAMFESAAERAGLDLVVDCEGGHTAYVDREHWAKVVLNLVSNAVKFTFEGRITVALRGEGACVVLTVGDTGAGIPESELPHLFERFHRVPGSRSRTHEGTGIGLALVRELVEQHGGRVGVTSSTGADHGSTFRVELPVGAAHLPADRVRADGPAEVGGAGDGHGDGRAQAYVDETFRWLPDSPGSPDAVPGAAAGPAPGAPRVLVVDDNGDMRRYIADLLRPTYDVRTAVDGLDALRQMSREAPDLVLTDVMMPELDGFGLLRRMRDEPELTTIPVIMLSARAGEDGTLEGLEAGADDYLVKPFSARELLARVRVHLELDRAERLREALERSSDLLDQAQRLAQTGSWELDPGLDRLVASPTFLDMVEHTREDLERLGATRVIESLVHPDDLAMVRAALAEATERELVDYETRIVLPSGGVRLFHARGQLVTGRDGRPRVRGSFQDITEQRALQQRLITGEAEREVTERERQIARDLQASLLPATEFDAPGLDVATYYRAGVVGTQVGGDWYDVIDLGAGRTAVVIGDVMGRGVRAAAVMGQLRAATRAFAELDLSPDDVLERLDPLVQALAVDQIVTCVYAVFDAAGRTLSYANAGHLPPLLARAGGPCETLGEVGPPLGAGYYGFPTTTVGLGTDDVLMLYTDGLVERRGEDLQVGLDRLAEVLTACAGAAVPAVLEQVVATLTADGVDDDVALVVARTLPADDAPELHLRVEPGETSTQRVRSALTDQLAEWGTPPSRVQDVVIAASELVTNGLLHGRGPVDVRLRRLGVGVVLEVHDRSSAPPRRRRPDVHAPSGRGLNLVAAVSDAWGSRPTADGKCVWASFSWSADEGRG